MLNKPKKVVFIAGSKSIGQYGGYESFVKKLIEYQQNRDMIQYRVACKKNGPGRMNLSLLDGVHEINKDEFEYCGARGLMIPVWDKIGPAQSIVYDLKAIRLFCKIIKNEHIEEPIVYILACRIGPFMRHYVKRIHRFGGKVYVNPDGHEWKRAKWSVLVREYWKLSERLMIKHCDLAICDSKLIEEYIHQEYDGKCKGGTNPRTTYISYGTEILKSKLDDDDEKFKTWMNQNGLKKDGYYLVVGRFVPENNYETIIREFMSSRTNRKLVIITTESPRFSRELERKLHFSQDDRIIFPGTVYDCEMLKKIREFAHGYIHGHEVGGTNPSLLEALGSTKLNILLDVGFNEEVGKDAALYFSKDDMQLCGVIQLADSMNSEMIDEYGEKAKRRIKEGYMWEIIVDQYETLWGHECL